MAKKDELAKLRKKLKDAKEHSKWADREISDLRQDRAKYRNILLRIHKWLAENDSPNRLYGIQIIAEIL